MGAFRCLIAVAAKRTQGIVELVGKLVGLVGGLGHGKERLWQQEALDFFPGAVDLVAALQLYKAGGLDLGDRSNVVEPLEGLLGVDSRFAAGALQAVNLLKG